MKQAVCMCQATDGVEDVLYANAALEQKKATTQHDMYKLVQVQYLWKYECQSSVEQKSVKIKHGTNT